MKKVIVFLMVLGMFIGGSGLASANGFYAITNEIGYQGTVWNITDGTGPWQTSTPRDGYLYAMVNYPGSSDYSYIMSNWSEHAQSNTNDSFLQIGDNGNVSVTGATGGWDASMKVFNVDVSGQNANYGNTTARFWQPDNGVAWGVNFTNYTYAFTATFPTAASLDIDGFYANTSAPDSIVGSFTGQFVVTHDVNKDPITNGDLYGFDINFSKAMFAPLDGTSTSINYFGAVPEPATMLLLGLGLAGLAGIRRKLS